jgi:hypothetical protein
MNPDLGERKREKKRDEVGWEGVEKMTCEEE